MRKIFSSYLTLAYYNLLYVVANEAVVGLAPEVRVSKAVLLGKKFHICF
jgi:hypothetical protein